MKYIISTNGADIAVALLEPNTAEQDINLSHNILNTNVNRSFYNGVLNFPSLQSFYRFLINKYYLMYWGPNKTFRQLLKKATNKARQELETEVQYQNFMPQIYSHNYARKINSCHKWHHPKYNK